MKKLIALILSIMMVVSTAAFRTCAANESEPLQFNKDGKFKIMQISDVQDILLIRPIVKDFIRDVLKKEKPDLVVLTGDNISSGTCTIGMAATPIITLMKIFKDYGVKVAMVFGNHDDETTLANKDIQFKLYQGFDNFVGYVADKNIAGKSNYNLPILSSDGQRIAFNVWCIDSLTYNDENDLGGYGCVHKDQIEWYKKVSNQLKVENGDQPVYSFMFQHIVVPEIFDALTEVSEDTQGSVERGGKYYVLPEGTKGKLHEGPCPPNYNNGQFAAVKEQGDVLAMAFGHDHTNSFEISYQGVQLINTPGVGFNSYGDETRGCRVFIVDENTPKDYKTYCVSYSDVDGSQTAHYRFIANGGEYDFSTRVKAFFEYLNCCVKDLFEKLFILK